MVASFPGHRKKCDQVVEVLGCRPRGPGFWLHWQQGFPLFRVPQPWPKNWGEGVPLCALEGTLSHWSRGPGLNIGSCHLQALVSHHHYGKPLRGNRNKTNKTCDVSAQPAQNRAKNMVAPLTFNACIMYHAVLNAIARTYVKQFVVSLPAMSLSRRWDRGRWVGIYGENSMAMSRFGCKNPSIGHFSYFEQKWS